MVEKQVIDEWRNAPRLTTLAGFFERTASGKGGAPDRREPDADLSLLDFDLDCTVFASTHRRLWGAFDSHYFASIPFRLEEECRVGSSLLSLALRKWARSGAPSKLYTLGTGTGCLARTLATLGDGRIEALCCSPTTANRDAFFANRGSEHAHFFHGPFFDLTEDRYNTDPELRPFRDGFDVLLEDTTFQMYNRDRLRQLDFIAPRIKPGGLLVQIEKLAHLMSTFISIASARRTSSSNRVSSTRAALPTSRMKFSIRCKIFRSTCRQQARLCQRFFATP